MMQLPILNAKHTAVITDTRLFVYGRQLYWSDCSRPTTIQTASAIDGSDKRVLVTDTEHLCITALAIDLNSQSTSIDLIQYYDALFLILFYSCSVLFANFEGNKPCNVGFMVVFLNRLTGLNMCAAIRTTVRNSEFERCIYSRIICHGFN